MPRNRQQKRRTSVNIDSSTINRRFQQPRQIKTVKKQKASTKNDDFDEKKEVSLQNIMTTKSVSSQSDRFDSKFIGVYISTASASTENLITKLNMIKIKSTDEIVTSSNNASVSIQQASQVSQHVSASESTEQTIFISSRRFSVLGSSEAAQQNEQKKKTINQSKHSKMDSVEIWNFTQTSRKALKTTIRKKVVQDLRKKMTLTASKEGKPIKLTVNEQTLIIDHLIRLMSLKTRFVVERETHFIILEFMSEMSMRKITKTFVIQTYIEVFKNITLNRIYNRKKWKIMTGFSCFLRISDKKHRITKKELSQYLLMNFLDRVIKEEYIWFKKNMTEKIERNTATLKAANKHRELKAQNWKTWIRDCENYWVKKIAWKYHTVVRIYGVEGITFLIDHFFESLLKLMSSINNSYPQDFHEQISKW